MSNFIDFLRKDKIDQHNDTLVNTHAVESKYSYICSYSYVLSSIFGTLIKFFLFFGIEIVKIHFIGKDNDLIQFNALGLGVMFYLFAYFLAVGLTEGMFMECYKSYNNRNFSILNIQVNQTRFLILLFSIFYAIISFFLSKIFLTFLIGNETQVQAEYIDLAVMYIKYTTPAFFLELQYEVFARFSEAQEINKQIYISLVSGVVVCIILCFVFLDYLNLGIVGCILITNIVQFVKLSIMVYTYLFIIHGYTYDIFNGAIISNVCNLIKSQLLWMFISLTTYSVALISIEVSSTLGVLDLSKMIIIMTILQLAYCISLTLSSISNYLISELIILNSPKLLPLLVKKLVLVNLFLSLPLVILINAFPNFFISFVSSSNYIYGYEFTLKNEDGNQVVEYSPDNINTLIYLVSAVFILECYQATFQGIVRSLGKHTHTIILNIISFLVVFPFGAVLMTKIFLFGLKGILFSILIVYVLNITLLSLIFYRTSYQDTCYEYLKQSVEPHYHSLETSPTTEA